ncbi:MAG: hypothetical protein IPP37_14215 [Saprospiraceae bacterium]|nr:hypothetical protein [Saprospiraceae bacterium]
MGQHLHKPDWWWEVYLNPYFRQCRLSYDGAWGYPQDFVSKVDQNFCHITKPVINNAVEILPYYMVPQSFGRFYLVLHMESGIPSPQSRDDNVDPFTQSFYGGRHNLKIELRILLFPGIHRAQLPSLVRQ